MIPIGARARADDRRAGHASGDPTGAAVPEPAASASSRRVTGTTLDGDQVSIDDFRRAPGSWSTSSRAGASRAARSTRSCGAFDAAARAEGDAALREASRSATTPADVRAFFKENGGDWPVVLDDPRAASASAYGVAKVPETFLVAPDGTVVYKSSAA